jgi:hypothetical protein
MSAVDKARLSVPKNKLDELHITEIIEGVINPAVEAGEWIRRIDIIDATIKDKTYLSLVETGGTSKCKNECTTIAKSCQTLMHEEVDIDELSALIWKNKSTLKDLKVRRQRLNTRMHPPQPNPYPCFLLCSRPRCALNGQSAANPLAKLFQHRISEWTRSSSLCLRRISRWTE